MQSTQLSTAQQSTYLPVFLFRCIRHNEECDKTYKQLAISTGANFLTFRSAECAVHAESVGIFISL